MWYAASENADIREVPYGTTADSVKRRPPKCGGRPSAEAASCARTDSEKCPVAAVGTSSPKGHGVLQGVLQLYHRGIPAALGTAA